MHRYIHAQVRSCTETFIRLLYTCTSLSRHIPAKLPVDLEQNTFHISRNFLVLLVSQKKFRKISSNTYCAKWFWQNFLKQFLYFGKFCRVFSFGKEMSQNFVKYLFCEKILRKYREILRNTFCISRNFVVFLVVRQKFREISSNFAKWFCRNIAKFRNNFFYFAKFCFTKSREILRNYFKKFHQITKWKISQNFAKFRFAKFSWPPY